MESPSKKRKNWFGQLWEKLRGDIFARTRAKFLASYIAIGIVLTAIAGYLIYRNTLYAAQDIVLAAQEMLQHGTAASGNTIAQSAFQAISAQIWKANILIGALMFLILGIYAYVLARVTLWPIQKAVERQQRFAANVAHELRTPLSAMKTSFEVALMGAHESAAGDFPDTLRSGIEEVDRMTDIVQFLLTSSAFDARRTELEFSDLDLAALVRETLDRMKPLIGVRAVAIHAECPLPVMVHGNATTLGEMLLNLTKNALAYTPPRGSVVISAKTEQGIPTLSVSDTGIGIPPADLPNIFEPFYRGENAYSQRSKKRGSGLGLAIVKEVVTLHKARIAVESELGKGTTISVKFPPVA